MTLQVFCRTERSKRKKNEHVKSGAAGRALVRTHRHYMLLHIIEDFFQESRNLLSPRL
ncbi:unnamed protein product [Amoebophrya sp. A25]|nr:unnamed protein product [Amoebophrya sp. A25]|eukprot:GSA25T00013185001.1